MPDTLKTSRLLTFGGVVVVVAALYLAREVLMPFALAGLVTFLLSPIVVRIERYTGRIVAVVVVVLLGCGVLGCAGYLVAGQLTEVAEVLPQYRDNIARKLGTLRGGALEKATEAVKQIQKDIEAQHADEKQAETEAAAERGARDRPGAPATPRQIPGADEPTKVQVVKPTPTPLELIAGAFGPLLGPLGTGGMVIVLILFMLLARDDLRDRIVRLMGRGRIRVTTQAMDEAGKRVSRYLAMQTLVSVIDGTAVAIGLFFLDVPNSMLWGLLSMVLRFVPYVGPFIGAALPILVAFAGSASWTQPLLVAGYFIVLELISNNVLEPWLYGSSAGVSPLAVIVTAIFWTWLWGPIGLLLSTPLTVCMVVLGRHVPQLRFIDILLGEEPPLEPHARFYQRLVALDQEEATELAEKFLAERGALVDAYDELLVPALSLAEMDRHADQLDAHRAKFIHAALRDLIDELAELAARLPPSPPDQDGAVAPTPARDSSRKRGGDDKPERTAPPLPVLPAALTVLVLPARDEADELVGAMLAQVVRGSGAECAAAPVAALSSGVVDVVQQHAADIVCISALPPAAAAHARHMYKRVVARFPDVGLVIGLWHANGTLDKARARIGCSPATPMVTSLRDAVAELELTARRLPVRADDVTAAGASGPRAAHG